MVRRNGHVVPRLDLLARRETDGVLLHDLLRQGLGLSGPCVGGGVRGEVKRVGELGGEGVTSGRGADCAPPCRCR